MKKNVFCVVLVLFVLAILAGTADARGHRRYHRGGGNFELLRADQGVRNTLTLPLRQFERNTRAWPQDRTILEVFPETHEGDSLVDRDDPYYDSGEDRNNEGDDEWAEADVVTPQPIKLVAAPQRPAPVIVPAEPAVSAPRPAPKPIKEPTTSMVVRASGEITLTLGPYVVVGAVILALLFSAFVIWLIRD